MLRTQRHQDTHLIATLYTRGFGMQSFIVKGYHGARARSKFSYFQPLSIVEILFQVRPNRDMHQLTENRLACLPLTLQSDPVKLSIGLSIAEIFVQTVREEEGNPDWYDFLKQILLALDESSQRLVQWFIYFLLHHTRYLGFFPNDQTLAGESASFDLANGVFRPSEQRELAADVLRKFLYAEAQPLPAPASCQQILLDGESKREALRTLFDYYRCHIDGFRYPQTLKVFAEVFA